MRFFPNPRFHRLARILIIFEHRVLTGFACPQRTINRRQYSILFLSQGPSFRYTGVDPL